MTRSRLESSRGVHPRIRERRVRDTRAVFGLRYGSESESWLEQEGRIWLELDVMAEQKSERECAMEAERLGNKLKGAMNGGKSQLVKILKVRIPAEHRTSAPDPVSPRGNLAPEQRLNLN